GIGISVYVDANLILSKIQTLCRRANDPKIRLVGNEEIDTFGRQIVPAQQFLSDLHHVFDGKLIYGASILMDIVKLLVHRLMARRSTTTARRHVKVGSP